MTREVNMYKISLICVILLGLGACATPVQRASSPALLDFADFAVEISVQHEVIDSNPAVLEDLHENSVD